MSQTVALCVKVLRPAKLCVVVLTVRGLSSSPADGQGATVPMECVSRKPLVQSTINSVGVKGETLLSPPTALVLANVW